MVKVLYLLFLLFEIEISLAHFECESRKFSNADSTVCVCNATYCDTVAKLPKLKSSQFVVYTSNIEGLRLSRTVHEFSPTSENMANKIVINPKERFQEMIGFGGAFTDSTGINIKSLDNETQENLLKSYFSPDGIEYNLGRVPIASTEFSTRLYSYDDVDGDTNLTYFSLQVEDHEYKLPFMKRASEMSEGGINFIAAAWLAPTWMKNKKTYPTDFSYLMPENYEVWANYHVRFMQEYKKQGFEMWGISTANEPTQSLGNFTTSVNTDFWSPNFQAEWLQDYLGPDLRAFFPDTKIIIVEDQRYMLPWSCQFLITDDTNKYVDGIGVHWYMDCGFSANLLTKTHEQWPTKFILPTEGCIIGQYPPVLLGSWTRGESYSDDIIDDCLNWGAGWVDLNMALNLDGGPTYVGKYVDSPIIVNRTSGEFYKQPMFYHMGHFSKFIPPGSVRIGCKFHGHTANLRAVAFKRPDGANVVVILNKNDKPVSMNISPNEGKNANVNLSKRSITTIVFH